jgi:hypothetical protein
MITIITNVFEVLKLANANTKTLRGYGNQKFNQHQLNNRAWKTVIEQISFET